MFLSEEELQLHESSTHSNKYNCEYCEKSFSREFAYISHLVDAHYEEEQIKKEKEKLVKESLKDIQLEEDLLEESLKDIMKEEILLEESLEDVKKEADE